MRGRRLFVALAAIASVWVSVGVIHAITHGEPDGNRHPYVAALYFNETGLFCSGSLIAPRVVLTAGHCTTGATTALVWFDTALPLTDFPPAGGIPSTAVYTHPDFTWDWQGLLGWDSVDTGVVILSTPVVGRGAAALPDAGLVDTLPMKTPLDVVGYGVSFKAPISGPPGGRWVLDGVRHYAPSQIVTSENRNSDRWLKFSANPAQGKGGMCFGDSGGPDLLGGTNIILATNSYVTNRNCTGVDYSNRVDRPVVLNWVTDCIDNLDCE